MRKVIFAVLFVAGILSAIADANEVENALSAPELRIYPFRADPAEHPDFNLRHYTPIHRNTRPGPLLYENGGFGSTDTGKFHRTPGSKNSLSDTKLVEDLIELVEEKRNDPDVDYAGVRPGESDRGYVSYNDELILSMGRSRQDRHWSMVGDYYDAYGRMHDYQVEYAYDYVGAQHMAQAGFTSHVERQTEADRGLLSLYWNMHRSILRQYGVSWGMQINAIRKYHTPEDYEIQAGQGTNSSEVDAGDSNAYKNYSDSYAKGWRYLVWGYMNSAMSVKILALKYTRYFDENNNRLSVLTPLGEIANEIQESLTTQYPDPGAVYTPVAFMQDFFSGWKHSLGFTYDTWDSPLFDEGDYSLLSYFSVLYPDYDPRSAYNSDSDRTAHTEKDTEYNQAEDQSKYLAKESHTPYGDMADLILSDARPELLNRYSVIVYVSDVHSDFQSQRDKLEAYVRNGGNLIISAKQAEKLFPEYNLQDSGFVSDGTYLQNAKSESVLKETNGFDLYEAANLPDHDLILKTPGGKPVLVEIPLGQGTISLSLSSFGLAYEDSVPKVPYVLVEHVKETLKAKANQVKLFNLGSNPDIHHITTRDKDGYYSLAVMNISEKEQNFFIKPDNGSIIDFQEIYLGDPTQMIQDGSYFQSTIGLTKEEKEAAVQEKIASWVGDDGAVNIVNGSLEQTQIRGAGVRLFRFKLSDESSFTIQTTKVLYPERPADWYLNLSIQQLRRTLIRMPEYYTHFGGVKIEGSELLGSSDEIIDYEHGWFKVKHVDFLVDARDISDDSEKLKLLAKVGRLSHGAKVVFSGDSASLEPEADLNGADLISESDVSWIDQNTIPDASTISDASQLKVLNLYYQPGNEQWSNIYNDLRQLTGDYADLSDVSLTGAPLKSIVELTTSETVAKQYGTEYYLSLKHVDNLPRWIEDHKGILSSKISGINLDSHYIFGKTVEQLLLELEWIRARGLDLSVDISSHVKSFRDVTFEPTPLRNVGKLMLSDVMQKMNALGIEDLIIAPPRSTNWNEEFTDTALTELFESAATNNVILHLRKEFGGGNADGFDGHTASQANFFLIKGAYENDSYSSWTSSLNSKFVSLVYDIGSCYTPVSGLSSSDGNLLSSATYVGKTLLLDAEYLNWEEILDDLAFIGNTPPALGNTFIEMRSDISANTVVGNAGAYDADIATGESQSLSYTLTGGTGAGLFEVDTNNGNISYLGGTTLEVGTHYTLNISVNDSVYTNQVDTGTVTLLVADISQGNPNLIAVDDAFIAHKDTTLTLKSSSSVRVNDIFSNSSTLSFYVVDQPQNGTVSLRDSNGRLDYTPDNGFTGVDTFTYQINDINEGLSNVATVTITVIEPSVYSITSGSSENGTITPQGVQVVDDGDSISFSISPVVGYEIADIMVNGMSVGVVSEYVFENVMADHTIEAIFVETDNGGGNDGENDSGSDGGSNGGGGCFINVLAVNIETSRGR